MDIERIENIDFHLNIRDTGTVWQKGYSLIAHAWAKLIQDERSSETARSELLQFASTCREDLREKYTPKFFPDQSFNSAYNVA
jgi:hypothetical protein